MSNAQQDVQTDVADMMSRLKCLYDMRMLNDAMDAMATEMRAELSNSHPILLCVLTGALIPMGHLLTRLDFPLEIDYVHASRYQGKVTGGSELNWVAKPNRSLKDRSVVIVDDILDKGITISEIAKFCEGEGAKSVKTAVFVDKQCERSQSAHIHKADFTGVEIEDKFVVGFGLDYEEYLRNLPGIFEVLS